MIHFPVRPGFARLVRPAGPACSLAPGWPPFAVPPTSPRRFGTAMPPASRLLGLILLLACLALSVGPAAAAAEPERDWQVFLDRNRASLVLQAARFKDMEESLPRLVRQFRRELAALETKREELSLIASLSGGNPWELRAVANDLERISRRAAALSGPFRAASEESAGIAARLEIVEKEFVKLAADKPDPDMARALDYYLDYLAGVKASLTKVTAVLERELLPAERLAQALAGLDQNLRQRVPVAWREAFFNPAPGVLSPAAWRDLGVALHVWLKSLTAYRGLARGEEAGGAVEGLIQVLVGLCLIFALDALAGRYLARRHPRLAASAFRRGGRMAALGLVAAWIGAGASLLLYKVLSVVSEIALAGALLFLSRFALSLAASPRTDDQAPPPGNGAESPVSPTDQDAPAVSPDPAATVTSSPAVPGPDPLSLPWSLFALAQAYRLIDPPEPLASLLLALALFLAGRRAGQALSGPGDFPSVVYRTGTFLYPLLGLMSLVGWVNLALLVLCGWFLLLGCVRSALASTRLMDLWLSSTEGQRAPLAIRAAVSGLGPPLAGIGLFFIALLWFSLQLGGVSVFVEALSFEAVFGEFRLSLGRMAVILTGFFLTRAAVLAARSAVSALSGLRPGLEPGLLELFGTTSRYVLWAAYILSSLFLLGFSLTSLAVVAGGLSVGIGFGLQNIVQNFIAGLILLFGRSFQAGETIQIGETWCRVKKVNIRNTVVETFDNATLFVPNSDLISSKIINWSHRDPKVRREVAVGVAYGTDTDKVRRVLTEAALSHPHVLPEPGPTVIFMDFGESSLDFKVLFWVDDVSRALGVTSDVRFEINRRFGAEGIEIPYPQREMRIREKPDEAPPKGA